MTARFAALLILLGYFTAHAEGNLEGLWTNKSLTQLERKNWVGWETPTVTPAKAEELATWYLKAMSHVNDQTHFIVPVRDPKTYKHIEAITAYDLVWTDHGSRLATVNGEVRTAWIVDPPNGRIPYKKETQDLLWAKTLRRLTESSERFEGPETLMPEERCLVGFGSPSGPPMLNTLYNNLYQIVQTPDHVVIIAEMNHDARIIRLNGKHLPENIRPWMGDSIGRWEGDTLVVETTNLNPQQGFSSTYHQAQYISTNSKITERFTRVRPDQILYQFEVNDPNAYTRLWRGEMPLNADPGPMYEYACHEGDRSRNNILAGARYRERIAKAK